MNPQKIRSLIGCVLLAVFSYNSQLYADQLALPSDDLIAPEIFHEMKSGTLQAGSTITISAKVTDNVGVKSVNLFYRLKGSQQYQRSDMTRIGDSDQYQTTLGQEVIAAPGIEYYIEASDLSGNTLQHGFPYSPLALSVSTAAVAGLDANRAVVLNSNKQPSDASLDKQAKSKTWMWIAGGVAVAAIIAASSKSSDDGGGTGTVVINGPSP